MSPTSYQTAPPRVTEGTAIIAMRPIGVKDLLQLFMR